MTRDNGNPSLGFVFPGQGSQSVGMMADLARSHAVVRATFDDASSVLGYDLWQLVQQGPGEDLNRTDRTQPAMLAAGVATWRVWQQAGGAAPSVMAGHSLGEYTALVCAGALGLSEAVTLVADRARFMQEAVPAGQGAMAAVLGLDDDKVVHVCAEVAQGDVVEAVNFNSPGQVVIAGTMAAVERAMDLARQVGAKRAVQLPVSVPSHCALMRPAAQRLAQRLAQVAFERPRIDVLHNADVAVHAEPDEIRELLALQLHSPVRWVETIGALAARGVDTVVECGPGKVLTGLAKRIDRKLQSLALVDPVSLARAIEEITAIS